MYSATPPPIDPAAKLDETWGVRRGVRLDFPGPAALAKNEAYVDLLRAYLADLLRPYGLRPDARKLASGGQSYGEMAEALVRLAVREHEPVDLLVLASTVPDIAPGRSTATYLSHVCPGTPLAFAVSDQGPAAAFTGLRLIREYARTDGLRRALLLVVEQNWLPYDDDAAALPLANSGVALLLGGDIEEAEDGDRAFGLETGGAAPPIRSARLDAAQVLMGTRAPEVALAEALDVNASDATVILGAGFASHAGADALADRDRVRLARSGQPATGVWWDLIGELSSGHQEPDAASQVVLADYDAGSAALCLAAFSAGW